MEYVFKPFLILVKIFFLFVINILPNKTKWIHFLQNRVCFYLDGIVGEVNIIQDKWDISMQNITLDVTFGFPSLSPPIQDPNFIGVHVNGRGLPVCWKELGLS